MDNNEKNPGDAERQFIAYLQGHGLGTGRDMLVPHLKRIRRALGKEKHPVSKQDVSQWDSKHMPACCSTSPIASCAL